MLSSDDRALARLFLKNGVLCEEFIDSLADALLISDAQCPLPSLSIARVPAAFTISVLGGALMLHSESSNSETAELSADFLHRQIRTLTGHVQKVVLATMIPSFSIDQLEFSLVQTISSLVSAQKTLEGRYHNIRRTKHLRFSAYISIIFPDGHEYTRRIDAEKFGVWYQDYEQRILGRIDDGVDGEIDPPPHRVPVRVARAPGR